MAIYSYALVDLNLTLINHPLWEKFREKIIQLGYFQRNLSTNIYLVIIISLTLIHLLVKNNKKIDPFKVSIGIGLISLFSYPFLSHDFFNYLFDAKILTFYQQNPYLHKALDFPQDPWLRFMHWTHRSYPYGPSWLIISLIPSFFSFGKFLLSFFFFKLMFIFFYLLTVYLLKKINLSSALFFATHPLVIIEGLVSPHNDLVAVSLAILGIYFLLKSKNLLGRFFLIFSALIKYLTAPLVFISPKKKKYLPVIFISLISILLYLSIKYEIQPWYFLSIFAFLPFYPNLINKINIFLIGLLFSYYPYLKFGGWDKTESIHLKHQIIIVFLTLNIIFIFVSTNFNREKNKQK